MKIVIAGAGAVGSHLAALLSREDQDIILIDENPEKTARLLKNDVQSQPVTLGVRPEHTNISAEGVPARVDVSEMMGSELHLHMNAGGQDIVAIIPTTELEGKDVRNGSVMKFHFPAKLIHLFSKETEENLI